MIAWNNDCVPNPVLPSPPGYNWIMENDEWIPVMTTLSPAAEALIQLVKCRCTKERYSTNHCQCCKVGPLLYARTFAAVMMMMINVRIRRRRCDDDDSNIEDEEDDDDDALN